MIDPVKIPEQKFLRECLRYDRSTGKLFWRKRPAHHFVHVREYRRWNTRYAGLEAFVHVTKWGHRRGRLDGVSYLAHRIIWKLVTGKEPPDVIDHRDRDGQNNRWRNLRKATTPQNCINGSRQGVHVQRGRWRARVTGKAGERIHVGYFSSKEEALIARRNKNAELHGKFAP